MKVKVKFAAEIRESKRLRVLSDKVKLITDKSLIPYNSTHVCKDYAVIMLFDPSLKPSAVFDKHVELLQARLDRAFKSRFKNASYAITKDSKLITITLKIIDPSEESDVDGAESIEE